MTYTRMVSNILSILSVWRSLERLRTIASNIKHKYEPETETFDNFMVHYIRFVIRNRNMVLGWRNGRERCDYGKT